MERFILILGIAFTFFQAASQPKSVEEYINSIFPAQKMTASPGVAITVIQNGTTVFKRALGFASLEHQIPFTHHSPVRLGYSGGREFMCAGLALMEAEGLLRFDDKVKKYFPKLPSWSNDVTIQDLLNHSSGFDDEWATLLLMHGDMNNRLDKEQFLTFLYRQPKPQVEPGKGYMYSNSDFALLRFIMEAASKQTLPNYLKKKLFEPLGMSSTFMNDDLDQIIPALAESYGGANGRFYKMGGVKTSPGGNYRMVTTANDLEKWAMAIDDTMSIVAKAFSRLYKNARVIPVLSPEKHYVFGHEWHSVNNVALVKHGGVNHDFYMFRIPSQHATVIGLGNSWVTMSAAMKLADSLLPGKIISIKSSPIFPDKPVLLNKNELAKYAGRYFEVKGNGHSSHLPYINFNDIKLEGESLNYYYTSTASFPMTSFGNGLFKDMDFDVPMQFTQSHPDSAIKLQAWTPDGQVLTFYKEINKAVVDKKYLEQFTGQYYSPHLDYYCRILLNDNGQLIIRRPTLSDKVLESYRDNSFLFEMEHRTDAWYVKATFTKDKNGKVDGINMQHIRMMHHRFDKIK